MQDLVSFAEASSRGSENPPRVVAVETKYSGWSDILVARIAVDGEEMLREVEDHGTVVGVLPYDPTRRCAILVSQVRAPMLVAHQWPSSLEIIAGHLDGDDPEQGARREAMEEAGLRIGALRHVVAVAASPGISTEIGHLYLAVYSQSDRVSDGGGLADEGERVSICEIGLDDLWQAAEAGRVRDAKTLILVQRLRIDRPELFSRLAAGPA